MTWEWNPLVIRELRRTMRLARIPWTVALAVVLVGLGMLATASVTSMAPADVGARLFQGFLLVMLTYAMVVGPLSAASTVALEREGRTLEPLLLTGLSPRQVASGMFAAVYGTLCVQLLSLAPLAAVALLFGGVGAMQVAVALVYVFVAAALGVALGLAVASRTRSLRVALVVSIALPTLLGPLALVAQFALGAQSARYQSGWDRSLFWWPSAYSSVHFGLDYVLALLLWPALIFGGAIILFMLVAAANLAADTDDRSTALHLWFIGVALALSVLTALSCFRVFGRDVPSVALFGMCFWATVLATMVLSALGEPPSASRRVTRRWVRGGNSWWLRVLGPGLGRSAVVQLVVAPWPLLACWAGALWSTTRSPWVSFLSSGVERQSAAPASMGSALAVFALYTVGFHWFLLGFGTLLRAGDDGPEGVVRARSWTAAAAVLATILPPIIHSVDPTRPAISAASPAFALRVVLVELGDVPDASAQHAMVAALIWGTLGLCLLGVALVRLRKGVERQRALLARTEAVLGQEDDEAEDEALEGAGP